MPLHEDHVHISGRNYDPEAASPHRPGSRFCDKALGIISPQGAPGIPDSALRVGIACQCEDGIFCSSMSQKVENDDIAAVFRYMYSKWDAFRVAGRTRRCVWMIPLYGLLVVNVEASLNERASWDGASDTLQVALDYSAPNLPGVYESFDINVLAPDMYKRLVGDKQIFFTNRLIGRGQDDIDTSTCKGDAHEEVYAANRIRNWTEGNPNGRIAAKFTEMFFSYCIRCYVRMDSQMVKTANNIR